MDSYRMPLRATRRLPSLVGASRPSQTSNVRNELPTLVRTHWCNAKSLESKEITVEVLSCVALHKLFIHAVKQESRTHTATQSSQKVAKRKHQRTALQFLAAAAVDEIACGRDENQRG